MSDGTSLTEGKCDTAKAWRDFKRSLGKNVSYPNQVSVSDKLDAVLGELADMRVSVERLDNVIPELSADRGQAELEAEGTEGLEELVMPEELDGNIYDEVLNEENPTDGIVKESLAMRKSQPIPKAKRAKV
jgi:hypothetical protein